MASSAHAAPHTGAHVDPRVAEPPTSPAETTNVLVSKYLRVGDNFWRAASVFGILTILGIIGFFMKLGEGFGVGDKYLWGYYVAMFSFMITTASAAPMVAIAPRMANSHWRRPLSRAAELWSVVGLFSLLWFIPLLWILPPLSDGRRSLWFFDINHPDLVPSYSPHIWASAAIVGLVLTGLALVWVSSLPDFASIAKRAPEGSFQQRWSKWMARGWQGTSAQWHMLKRRVGVLGAFYFMMLVFVHFLISVDFLMTLVPGWIDALYPVTHAANSLQAAAATMVLTAWVLRTFCGYERYIGLDQIWGLGKLMFALSLLWFWFWFSSFNVLWYGKKPSEQAVIHLLMTGPVPLGLHDYIYSRVRLTAVDAGMESGPPQHVGAAPDRGLHTPRHAAGPRQAVRSRILRGGDRQSQLPQARPGHGAHTKGRYAAASRLPDNGRSGRSRHTGVHGRQQALPDHELLGAAGVAAIR